GGSVAAGLLDRTPCFSPVRDDAGSKRDERMRSTILSRVLLFLLTLVCTAGLAHAQQTTDSSTATAVVATAPSFDAGNTSWMLTSTAWVLLMTLPGLALFYGGMVRKKNVLSVLMQVFATACVISLVWMVAGYSLAFTDGTQWIGGLGRAMLSGM